MKMFMHFTRCIRSTRRLARATGLSLGLAMAANVVADPAKITSQPSDLSAEAGTAASFSAEVSGSPNTYRWHRAHGGGGALGFAGGNRYVSVPIDVPETEYTVEFWSPRRIPTRVYSAWWMPILVEAVMTGICT